MQTEAVKKIAKNWAALMLCSVLLVACGVDSADSQQKPEAHPAHPKLFFIGQDLGAIRGYLNSGCCVAPDGTTAYIGLYKILNPDLEYGGLGIDENGTPLNYDADWNSGKMNALKNATEFDVSNMAIGLFIAENERPNALAELLRGEHDDKIHHLGKFIQNYNGTVYLRIGYEFDGAWNVGVTDPNVYQRAYRRIVDVLRADGVTNIQYVWQASTSPLDDVIEGRHEDISDWYPGDEYVDWMGLSWFLPIDDKPKPESGYAAPTQRMLADELVAMARERGKPVMVAELSTQGFDLLNKTRRNITPLFDGAPGEGTRDLTSDQIWDIWFAPMFQYMNSNADVIRSLAYINVNWDSQSMWGPPYAGGYWGDSRIEVDDVIAARFNDAMSKWRADTNVEAAK